MIRKWFFHSPIRYALALLIGISVSVLVITKNGYNISPYVLFDCLSVSGLLLVLIGGLVILAYLGAYDSFGYTVNRMRSGKNNKDNKDKTYTDYIERKKMARSNKIATFVPYVATGVLFIFVSYIIKMFFC